MNTFGNLVRGVALGDAWGEGVEFQKIGSIVKDDDKGPKIPQHLRITDDTQMTLFLADALDLAREEDRSIEGYKQAIMEAFLDYYSDPDTHSRAPGVTVMGSLGGLSRKGEWQKATNTHSDGSGTVMRTSPTALLDDQVWVGATAFAAAVTHGTPNAIAAAILDVAILRLLIKGEANIVPGNLLQVARALALDPEAAGLLDVEPWLEGFEIDLRPGFEELVRLIDIALEDLPTLQSYPWALNSDPSLHVGGGGWRAHETLVIALLAVDMLPKNPVEALRRSVASDGDSDTIGAVTGALLGAANPGLFVRLWDAGLGERFEPRYQRWIENEADDYLFVAPAPRTPWYRKILTRN